MRPAHAERKRARAVAKTFLRALAPAARAAYMAMQPGDEGVIFLPSGRMAHLFREDEIRFRVRELEDISAATEVAMKWAAEESAAEAVQ